MFKDGANGVGLLDFLGRIGRTSKPAAGEGETADRRSCQEQEKNPPGRKRPACDLHRKFERGTEAARL
jgi:hypothetical protein